MIQPPADITIGQASVMHYTWGAIISDKTEPGRKFDKRVRRLELVAHTTTSWDADKEFQLQDKKRIQNLSTKS